MDKREILYRKILNQVALKRILAFWRYKDQRITMAYGTFETLKPGNVDMLVQAANHGDVLLVAIRSDKLVKNQKGEGRPIYNQFNRAYILASQLMVSGICVVEEGTLFELVDMVRPDFTAFCKNASEEEKKVLQGVIDWGGEYVEVDTEKTLSEPISTEGSTEE
jgi:bifunctional ADP-heptose synthase (sugar kinase/adenylyltransferase)